MGLPLPRLGCTSKPWGRLWSREDRWGSLPWTQQRAHCLFTPPPGVGPRELGPAGPGVEPPGWHFVGLAAETAQTGHSPGLWADWQERGGPADKCTSSAPSPSPRGSGVVGAAVWARCRSGAGRPTPCGEAPRWRPVTAWTSLQACRYGHVQQLEHLLFYGADMGAQNASGNTALHICALYNQV